MILYLVNFSSSEKNLIGAFKRIKAVTISKKECYIVFDVNILCLINAGALTKSLNRDFVEKVGKLPSTNEA